MQGGQGHGHHTLAVGKLHARGTALHARDPAETQGRGVPGLKGGYAPFKRVKHDAPRGWGRKSMLETAEDCPAESVEEKRAGWAGQETQHE